jgi:putative FmdB family regulatory protein
MAAYDYQCDKCEAIWEVEHGMNETPKLKCPECDSKKLTKLFSAPFGMVRGNLRWQDMKEDKNFQRDMNRDMQLHTLENHDPYAHMRPDGDKGVIKDRLNKIGTMNHDSDGNYTGKRMYVSDGRKKKAKKKASKASKVKKT